jgi:ABC-type oligopeptide transport system ATPase subunit
VEFGPSDAIYANPQNEYTRKLIASIPRGRGNLTK